MEDKIVGKRIKALNFEQIISLKKLGKGNPTPWNKAA